MMRPMVGEKAELRLVTRAGRVRDSGAHYPAVWVLMQRAISDVSKKWSQDNPYASRREGPRSL
eukprot:9794596-Lingulodinium_polyedra.AAC.2